MPPALLEDPSAPLIPPPTIPASLPHPRSVYLKDHVSAATIIPIYTPQQVPITLLTHLQNELNNEIERGDTYPMDVPMSLEMFQNYWFGTFAAVMLLGNHTILQDGRDWENECLGTFYIKPNFPGRCNHICNAGFLVCNTARGKGVGKILGETYLDYAPKLGYTYSQFNLVFETNIASCKIWDSLGFKRIGLVKGAGRLKGHAQPVNAIIYGRDLDDEDYVSEERFDKIRFYLEKGKYPPSADRSEKSRLRAATTHYRLENGKLMLKGKEVVADSQKQYEIAKRLHSINHGGINKTTAMITDKFHWVRIKETVSQVIKNCAECKEHTQAPPVIKNEPITTTTPRSAVGLVTSPPPNLTPMMQTFDLNTLPQATMTNLADMDIPVDPAMMEDVHGLAHHHHHQQHTQLAPVAQMHPSSITGMMGGPNDNTDLLGNPRTSSAQSAEIARAALTEEDRAMRNRVVIEHKLYEELKDYSHQAMDGLHHHLDGNPLP